MAYRKGKIVVLSGETWQKPPYPSDQGELDQ